MLQAKRFVLLALLVVSLFTAAALPQQASAHSKDGTLYGTYNKSVERWRSEVAKQLKAHNVWSKYNEALALNIIKHESGGNPKAKNGTCWGLMQFNSSWSQPHAHNRGSWRLNGKLAIHKFVHSIKEDPDNYSAIKQHWAATYKK